MAASKYKKDFKIFPLRKSGNSLNDQNKATLSIDWVNMDICVVFGGLFNTTQFGVWRTVQCYTIWGYQNLYKYIRLLLLLLIIIIIINLLPIIDIILN